MVGSTCRTLRHPTISPQLAAAVGADGRGMARGLGACCASAFCSGGLIKRGAFIDGLMAMPHGKGRRHSPLFCDIAQNALQFCWSA